MLWVGKFENASGPVPNFSNTKKKKNYTDNNNINNVLINHDNMKIVGTYINFLLSFISCVIVRVPSLLYFYWCFALFFTFFFLGARMFLAFCMFVWNSLKICLELIIFGVCSHRRCCCRCCCCVVTFVLNVLYCLFFCSILVDMGPPFSFTNSLICVCGMVIVSKIYVDTLAHKHIRLLFSSDIHTYIVY